MMSCATVAVSRLLWTKSSKEKNSKLLGSKSYAARAIKNDTAGTSLNRNHTISIFLDYF